MHTHTCKDIVFKTGQHYHWSSAALLRHQRKQQLAPCTEKGREKDDRGSTQSVRSNVRSLLSSSAHRRAPFILADSYLCVKLTSLHELGCDAVTVPVQLRWQFHRAITQLQGAGLELGNSSQSLTTSASFHHYCRLQAHRTCGQCQCRHHRKINLLHRNRSWYQSQKDSH